MNEEPPTYTSCCLPRDAYNVSSFHLFSQTVLAMSLQSTFSNFIHIRDFVDNVIDDPTRGNAPNYVEIQADINIFEEDGFYSSGAKVEPIHALIHTYLAREERELYVPNTFFFADGRFSASLSPDGVLEINAQTLNLKGACHPIPILDPSNPHKHPVNVSDFDEYRRHLPEQWCPMVTVIGSVSTCNNDAVDAWEPRRFAVETSVYEPSKPAPYHDATRKQKKTHWEDFLADNANIWKAAKYLDQGQGVKYDKLPQFTRTDGTRTTSPQEQTRELLATFFPPLPQDIVEECSPPRRNPVEMPDITMEEIETQLCKMKPWKAPGEDGLPVMAPSPEALSCDQCPPREAGLQSK
ncbi:uncharacterized protein VDAG_04848 [Verticillium dahliae VdLs.17]|uniref:Uncharacterized protein n=1 Tax=Verticillium dahliae (strain VdLs.17 / ATCC MYA-4575 / FGSC 10137) TaxID=498257 RepID=G2X363_VERDV|nr:uncharacterized protein VDAG_04848 [Verticillium dahliae VdLs.17]EGY23410.1 hypothetical protein VDAG_04848 [Verticillium dahliae VdLs.17]